MAKEAPEPMMPPPDRGDYSRSSGSGFSHWWLIIILVIVAGLGTFVWFQYNAKATVQLTLKHFTANLDDDFTAVRNTATNASTKDLLFEIITVDTDSVSTTVPATGSKQVSQNASGKVIIYNKTTSSQKLIATTRLETPEGKIYRIREAVTIPAAKKAGTQVTPGSVEVTAVADKPGADFNIGLTDFTLPGLKSDPRYEQIYARSKVAMTGGVVGQVAVVDAAAEAAARQQLRQALTNKLVAVARERLPARAWLSNKATVVEFEATAAPVLSVAGDKKEATITESGHLWGIVFNRVDLAREVAKKKVPEAVVGDLTITNIDDLTLALKDEASVTSESSQVTLHLTGQANFLPQLNITALQEELAGSSRNQIEIILQRFPLVNSANISLRPPWLRQLPEKDKIEIRLDQE
jgi:hypothetical protein